MTHPVTLVVHGHFYQPPRENPWVGLIERQDSARPHHDWNDRIAAECYTPNAFARILDDHGKIRGIVNVYEMISFNFGPTLLAWLEIHAPATYLRILEADRRSLAARGHGNAIAQAYNHAILPLCNERDRRTQIRWGLADFEARFGRRAEAMWLPETAINEATVEALIDEGMKFVILSPHQAESARDSNTAEWFDVAGGTIDPTQPYRLFAQSGRSIDCFFYDGPISNAIGFSGALSSSSTLIDRLSAAVRDDRDRDQIIHVATDGESYGHHTAFGERTLAYALAVEAPRRGLAVTNYGAYLAAHPPLAEARLKPGPSSEGTAWSCSHGVGRWARDCGCSAGTVGWNQAWRGPLRGALDLVRDRCAQLFESRGAAVLNDPWAARDAYIDALGSPAARERFLAGHVRGEPVQALRLLEMQRQALLMYTSCGWFFDELSGLEGQQVLRYAARAIEHYEAVAGEPLEPAFLGLLADAPSNITDFANGAEVYRRLVAPSRVDHARLAAQEAILSLFVTRPRDTRIGDWQVHRHAEKRAGDARFALVTGRMSLVWQPTGEAYELAHAVLHLGGADVCCAVRPHTGNGSAHKEAVEAVWQEWPRQNIARLLRAIERGYGAAEYTVKDLLFEERERVLRDVYGELLAGVGAEYARLYDNHRHTMHVLRDAGLPIPEPLRQAAETVLGARFEAEIARQRRSRDPARYRRALEMAEDARKRGLTLQRPLAQRALTETLTALLTALGGDVTPENVSNALAFLGLARALDVDPVSARAQEALYEITCAHPEAAPLLQPLANELGFAPLPLQREAQALAGSAP